MKPPPFFLDTDTITHGITRLPSLPAVVMELLASLNDDNVDAATLANKIARDQALVARLLRIANSPFYGLQGRVNSVNDAVVVLGLRQVRMLAIAVSTAGSFKLPTIKGFNFRAFWLHAILTAVGTRLVAQKMHLPEENAFVAGLLHDIGRLAIAASFPKHKEAVLQYQKQMDCDIVEAEQTVLGTDHTYVGQILAQQWRFPAVLIEAIKGHHHPESSEQHSLNAAVHLGNAIAHALDLCEEPQERVSYLSEKCWIGLKLNQDELMRLFAEIENQFTSIREALAV